MTPQPHSSVLRTSDFDYDLPESLIAQTPIEPRDHSRLMSLSRTDGSIRHHRFYDLPQLLRPGDLMVFNDSRVMPARLRGTRSTGGAIETAAAITPFARHLARHRTPRTPAAPRNRVRGRRRRRFNARRGP